MLSWVFPSLVCQIGCLCMKMKSSPLLQETLLLKCYVSSPACNSTNDQSHRCHHFTHLPHAHLAGSLARLQISRGRREA